VGFILRDMETRATTVKTYDIDVEHSNLLPGTISVRTVIIINLFGRMNILLKFYYSMCIEYNGNLDRELLRIKRHVFLSLPRFMVA